MTCWHCHLIMNEPVVRAVLMDHSVQGFCSVEHYELHHMADPDVVYFVDGSDKTPADLKLGRMTNEMQELLGLEGRKRLTRKRVQQLSAGSSSQDAEMGEL